ncbi:ThiF family adenylyltransferase (plasmid) [Fibrella sp. ES10-3-2-2]
MLHSSSLQPYIGELSVEVQSAIQEIGQYFGICDPKVLTLNQWSIVVPVTYKVSLPSRGAVDDIAISDEEPMLIRLSLDNYPHAAPFILSDRKDFPRSRLSHLYFTTDDVPAKLCLVRNSPHEWFATIKMSNFLDVGGQWLYKAATGQLDEDGDEFDPIRLEENFFSDHIYRYDLINGVVSNDQRFVPELPVALFGGAQLLKAGTISAYQTNVHVPFIVFEKIRAAIAGLPKSKSEDHRENPIFTMVFWDSNGTIDEQYLTSRPENYGQLKAFFSLRGINLHQALLKLEKLGAISRSGLSIIFAIKRPRKVIGYNGNYEFVNFLITLPSGGVAAVDTNTKVMNQGHIEPFSKGMASYLSAREQTPASLYIGAGSLGSKLILHDARSGNLEIGICDDDKMLPHNLARHELFADQLGRNKAEALVEVIKQFYSADNSNKIVAIKSNAINLDREFQEHQRIIDTTASVQVMNFLLTKQLPAKTRYYKAEIADAGALGLFYAEGHKRNPRMDDLVSLACFFATNNERLRVWRMNDAQREITTLNVGLGCSSTTSVMADDILSFHASVFSRILNKAATQEINGMPGILAISNLDETKGFPNINTEYIEVQAFDILNCKAGSGWEVRLRGGIKELLFENSNRHAPEETGGVLIGVANYKTKTIHVFDIISEPQGSHGTYCEFVRGANGLPAEIDQIKKVTGDVIGYIGEWHTHPMNLKRLSKKDEKTIAELIVLNRIVPIPTCALIVAPDELLVYVYE